MRNFWPGTWIASFTVTAIVLTILAWWYMSRPARMQTSSLRVSGSYVARHSHECEWVFAWDPDYVDKVGTHRVDFIEFKTIVYDVMLGVPVAYRIEATNLRDCLSESDRWELLENVAHGFYDRNATPVEKRAISYMQQDVGSAEATVHVPLPYVCVGVLLSGYTVLTVFYVRRVLRKN